jgi:hypothetical protein
LRPDERKTESRISLHDDERAARLSLLVMSDSGVFTYPLPERGEVTIGRSVRCAICVDDPRLSREQAMLTIGGHVEIIDLGSSNGTRVGEERLEPNTPRPLAIGEIVSVGSALMILQPAGAAPRLRHLWTHGYFEARLEDECARAGETGRPFAVARLRGEAATKVIEAWLAEHLRPMDVVAVYAPDEYEIFLPEVDPKSATAIIARLRSELVAVGDGRTRIGVACWPKDGRTPEELIARAAPNSRRDIPDCTGSSASDRGWARTGHRRPRAMPRQPDARCQDARGVATNVDHEDGAVRSSATSKDARRCRHGTS